MIRDTSFAYVLENQHLARAGAEARFVSANTGGRTRNQTLTTLGNAKLYRSASSAGAACGGIVSPSIPVGTLKVRQVHVTIEA